jgi:uncharacterized protein (TIGR03000 family)
LHKEKVMIASWKNRILLALLVSLTVVALLATDRLAPALAQDEGTGSPADGATATVTIIVPATAVVFVDGDRTKLTGTERRFTTPVLPAGRKFHYDILARWTDNGKTVERTRRVPVSAGANVRVSFVDDAKPDKPKEKGKVKDVQVVTSKPTKRVPASTINFKKAYALPFDSLATLGSRIDAARRKPDPVALGHMASELSIAEKVSKKKASLTSKALLAESAELAQLRRQVAELKATYAIHQQIADAETNAAFWNKQIALADETANQERQQIQSNTLPTDAPRRVLVNNYTTQYIDVWVNGNYKLQVLPGASKWFVIEHKWNPTVLTGYGNEDASATWGPIRIYGEFKTYTWNIQG